MGLFLKLIWKDRSLLLLRSIFKKSQEERLTLPDTKVSYEAIIMKTVWFWCRNKQKPWNTIGSLERD